MDIHVPYFDETIQDAWSIAEKDAFMKKNAAVIKKLKKRSY